jgi:gluconokinase
VTAVRFARFSVDPLASLPGLCSYQPLTIHAINPDGTVQVLSLDLGTSSTRAAFYDRVGGEVCGSSGSVARAFTVTAEGAAELDAEQFCADADAVVARSLATVGELRIAAVALATFWHALLGIDARGNPVTPIYGWADTRASREAEMLRERLNESETHRRTGCRFHAGYWPAKLMWLRANRPEQFARVAKWISPGDYLLSRWCGVMKTSVSLASATGLVDQYRCDWDEPMLAAVGIERSHLPELAGDAETFSLLPESRDAWPHLADARILPAIGDGAANNLGVGCFTRDKAALMIGTSGAMRILERGVPPAALPSGLWQYRLDRERVVVGGALSDGGGLFQWMKESLAIDLDHAALEAALGALEPDGHGLTVLPFWAGERSTGWNGRARGGVFGLAGQTDPIDILRAGMEGVAYRFAAIAEQLTAALPFETIYASGGALRESRVWAQILADVLGRPLLVTDVPEASGRGAALFALEALRALADPDVLAPPVIAIIVPNADNREVYERARDRQQALRDTLFGKES